MLAVIYRWRLKPGKEQQFIDAWLHLTKYYVANCGGLGSRLHRGPDDVWYAYAQWPNALTRDEAFAKDHDAEATNRMRDAVAEQLPSIALEPVEDELVSSPPDAPVHAYSFASAGAARRLPPTLSLTLGQIDAQLIRPLAICVFRRDDRILVIEAHDSVKDQTFYRPLGGGIEFGEVSSAALVREIREEIAAEVVDLEYIGTLENIFTYNGATGHEIIQVYDGRFANDGLYSASSIPGVESNGEPMRIVWKHLNSFSARRPLYPGGLLELLRARRS